MADQEGTRKRGDYQVISNAPDVCNTPSGPSMVPVAYQIIATFSPVVGTTPTVRFTGQEAFTLRSRILQVKGDEPGVGGGLQSGTFAPSGMCEPITSSTTVRAEHSPIVRHDDTFKMNTGNTTGKAVVPGGGGGASIGPSGEIEGNPNPPKQITPKQAEAALEGKGVLGQVGGFFKGAGEALWDMGKGIVSLGVGAAKLSPVSQAAEEFSQATGLFDYRGYSKTSEALNNTVETIANNPGVVWDGIKKPYAEAWERGDYGEALGRGVVDIGTIFVPGGGAAGKAGGAANVAGHVGEVGRLGEAVGAASKVGEAANVAGHVGEAGRLSEAVGVLGKVDEATNAARAAQAVKAGEETANATKAADAIKAVGKDGVQVQSSAKHSNRLQLTEAPITGSTRTAHRTSANRHLAERLRTDPEFAAGMNKELGTDVLKHMESGKSGLRNPPGTEWHHPKTDPKSMWLLRRNVHRDPKLQDYLHGGGRGGYADHYGK